MAMIFDTLKLSKSLRDAEFSERQANALAAALSEQAQDTLATKADLLHLEMKLTEKITELRAEFKAEIAEVRAEIAELKAEIAEVRAEIAGVRTEFTGEIAGLRAEMVAEFAKIRTEISLMRADTNKWIVTALAFNFVATAGLFVTFFKLFAK